MVSFYAFLSYFHIYAIILALNSNSNSIGFSIMTLRGWICGPFIIFSTMVLFHWGHSSVFTIFFTNIYNKPTIKELIGDTDE